MISVPPLFVKKIEVEEQSKERSGKPQVVESLPT